jgi:hypothetical protein
MITKPSIDQAVQIDADQALDQLLREDAHRHRDLYIDNDGFSDRVLQRVAAIPAPARFNVRRRMVIVSSLAAFASAVVMFSGSGMHLLIDAAMDVATETVTPAVIGVAAILVTATLLAIATAASEN